MSPDEFRAHIGALGFSQQAFALRIGVDKRTGQKWALGEADVPNPVAVLLRLLVARPELLEVMEAVAPAPAQRRRGRKGG